jgi:hypothetical protein
VYLRELPLGEEGQQNLLAFVVRKWWETFLLPFGQHLPKPIKTSAFFGGYWRIGTRGDETPFQPSRVSVPKGIDHQNTSKEKTSSFVSNSTRQFPGALHEAFWGVKI